MSVQCEFVCNFQDLKSFFSKNIQLDIVIKESEVMLLSSYNGIYSACSFNATVNITDEDALGGFSITRGSSIMTELLYKIPSNKNNIDIFIVEFINDTVYITINKYKIQIGAMVFDRTNILNIIENIKKGSSLSVKDFRWVHLMSRQYKDSYMHIVDNYVLCKTSDGIYAQIISDDISSSRYSFPSSILTKAYNYEILSVTLGNVLTIELDNNKFLLTKVFISNNILKDDIDFALKSKYKVSINLNLEKHKSLIRSIKNSQVSLNVGESSITILSDYYEELKFFLEDNISVNIKESKDFNKLMDISDEVNKIQIKSITILKMISNEIRGVTIYIGGLHALISFRNGRYLLMPRMI